MSKTEQFFSCLKGKRVDFLGIGVSHADTIKLFARKGIVVTARDRRDAGAFAGIAEELAELGVALRLGSDYLHDLDADVLFRTPGMNFNTPELMEYRRKGGVVTSEMEVFFDLCPCPIIAVTGSDGKTTTTTLIAEMLQAEGKTVHLGGNIGRALLPEIFSITPQDFAVVELSSFQLISMRRSPHIAVVTNVTPNHLDVHGTMEEYIAAKENILRHQNAFSCAVLGADNATSAGMSKHVRGKIKAFSLQQEQQNGAWLGKDGRIYTACNGAARPLFASADIRLPGIHNVANYLAAICAVDGIAGDEAMHTVAKNFGGVEHRIEFVREKDGVKWYNDSIATSPTRTIAGLRSFERKMIVIAGGYDKKIPFEPLAPEITKHVRLLILTGTTAEKIETAVRGHSSFVPGQPEIVRADSLAQAVQMANQMAQPGDIVSLSPACASFDAYPNFEARGRHFKELVNALR